MNQFSNVPVLTSKEAEAPVAPVTPRMRPADIVKLIKEGRKTILVFAVTAMFLAGLLVLNATPRYVAYSQMLLGEQGLSARNSFDLVAEQDLTSSMIEGELAVLRSNVLLHRVAEKLELLNVPEFNPAAMEVEESPSLIDTFKVWLRSLIPDFEQREEPEIEEAPTQISMAAGASASQLGAYKDAVGKLRRAVSVRQQGTSYVVQVSAESEDPELAAAISNTVMNEYVNFLTDKRFKAAQEFTHWLELRLTDLAVTLEESERAVVDYRTRLETGTDNRSRLDQQMSELTTRLVEQQTELTQIEAMYTKLSETIENDGQLAAQILSSSEAMLDYRSQMSDLIQREAYSVGRFGSNSAQVASIRSSISRLETAIEAEVRRELDRLVNQREVLTVVVTSLETSLSAISRQMLNQSGDEIQLSQLRRVADANRQVYQQFLGRFKELSELQSLQTPDAEIISYAVPPSDPVYPRRKLSLILAAIGGVFLAFAYLLVQYMQPKKIHTAQQLAQETGVGVLATIHGIGKDLSIYDLCRQLNSAPNSGLAKQAMGMANGIDMRAGGAARTIIVGSDADRIVRLHLVVMLAWAVSRKGRKCVFVDADFREAQLSAKLEYLKPKTHLAEVLYENEGVENALTRLPNIGAYFIPTETMSGADPAIVFNTERYHEVLQTLLSEADTVIIVPPPASGFTEAYTAMDEVDANIFVVPANTLRASDLSLPVSVAQSSKARSFGLVMTTE